MPKEMKTKSLTIWLTITAVVIALNAYEVWNLRTKVTRLENSNQSLRKEIITRRIAVVDSHLHPRAVVQVNPQNEDEAQIMLLAPDGRELVDIYTLSPSGAEMVFNSNRKYGNLQIGRLPQGDVVTGQPPDSDSVLWGVRI